MTLSTLLIAFVGGVLSFVSPCVLPLIPAYLAILTGMTLQELSDRPPLSRVMVPAAMFVLGFSVIYLALGAVAPLLKQFLFLYGSTVSLVGGIIIIAFGVLMTGIIRVPWLYGEAKIDPAKAARFGPLSGFVLGLVFAAGWSPCYAPIVGAVVMLAGSSTTAWQGAAVLLAYSLGFAVPFLAVALAYGKVRPLVSWLSKHSATINRAAGLVLIVMGVLLASGLLGRITLLIPQVLPELSI